MNMLSAYYQSWKKLCQNLSRVVVSPALEFNWLGEYKQTDCHSQKNLARHTKFLVFLNTVQCDSSQYGCAARYFDARGKTNSLCQQVSNKYREKLCYDCERTSNNCIWNESLGHMSSSASHVVVETDHLPLISVMKKLLHSALARLQRLLLALYGYDFELLHKAGSQIPVTDTVWEFSTRHLPGNL